MLQTVMEMDVRCFGVDTYRNALEQTNIEADLVPFHGRADDLDKGQGDLGVPLLRRLEDEVVERLADLRVLAVVGICARERDRSMR